MNLWICPGTSQPNIDPISIFSNISSLIWFPSSSASSLVFISNMFKYQKFPRCPKHKNERIILHNLRFINEDLWKPTNIMDFYSTILQSR